MIDSVYFHIGYPKAASSTLQKYLFQKHSEIEFLGIYPKNNIGIDSDSQVHENLFLNDPKLREFHNALVFMDSVEYANFSFQPLRDHLDQLISKTKKKIVFSNERFSGVFYSLKDRGTKIRRIKDFFPEAKILLIIRNQLDALFSQYRDHPFDPRNFETGQPMSFDNWLDICFKHDSDIKLLNSLKYDEMYQFLLSEFGDENVKVMSLENLKTDTEKFANELSDFFRINRNQSHNLLDNKKDNRAVSANFNKLRALKRKVFGDVVVSDFLPTSIRKEFLNRLKSGKPEQMKISEKSMQKLVVYFGPSNLALEKLLDTNIENYIGLNNS